MLDGSNDADSCKGVLFGGFVDIDPHFGGEIFQNPLFKPNGQNIKSFILSKLLH